MMRRDKKGQAAMEFLMTYGWAILAAIIVIGILGFYFFGRGILTPKASVVTAPFYLNAQNVRASTGVTLELKNNGDETLTINSIVVQNCAGTLTLNNGTSGGTDVVAGALISGVIDCAPSEGETFKGDITVTYKKPGSTVGLTSTGSITERVAA